MSRGRALISDTILYGAFTILQRFLTFFMMPLYTNYLDKQDYGSISNIFSWIAIFFIIYTFGFEGAFYRFFKEYELKKVFSTAFSFLIMWALLLSSIFIFTYDTAASFIGTESNLDEMVLLASLVMFVDTIMLLPFARLRMERKTLKFSFYKLITIVIAISLNIYFISYLGKTGEYAFLSQLIASICGVLILSPIIIKSFDFSFDKKIFKEMLSFAIPTVPAAIATIFLRQGDQVLIPKLAEKGKEALAIYAANYKLALPMMMFVTTFDYAWKPFYMSSFKEEGIKAFFAKVLNYYVFIGCLIFLVISFFIPQISQIKINNIYLLPPDYHSGLFVIPFALGGYFFLGFNNYFAMGLNITKKTKYMPVALFIASSFSLLTNIYFIPKYGISASAWITLISYMIGALALLFYSQKEYKLNYNHQLILTLIIVTLLLFLIDLNTTLINELFDKVIYILVLLFIGYFIGIYNLNLLKRILKRA